MTMRDERAPELVERAAHVSERGAELQIEDASHERTTMSTDEVRERAIELVEQLTERQLAVVIEILDDLVNIPLLRTDTAAAERARRVNRERYEAEAASRRWTNEGGASGEGVEPQSELEAVALRRVSATTHPAALHEQLTVATARRYAQQHPDWAVEADRAVDQVLEQVEQVLRVQRSLPAGMHSEAVAAWWDSPNAALYFDGVEHSPRHWLAQGLDPDHVVAAAEHEDAT
jgi:hypothetical protein